VTALEFGSLYLESLPPYRCVSQTRGRVQDANRGPEMVDGAEALARQKAEEAAKAALTYVNRQHTSSG